MTLNQRIVAITALITSLTAGVFLYVSSISQENLQKGMAEPVNVGKKYAWDAVYEKQLTVLQENADSLETSYEIKMALKSGDVGEITKHTDAFYFLLADQGVFDHLQIVNKDAEVVFSKPKQFQGKTAKSFVLTAIESGEPQIGFTLDDDGALVLGLAIPIKSRRKKYGAGIYLVDADTLAQSMIARDGGQVFLAGMDGALLTETEEGLFSNVVPKLPNPQSYFLERFSASDAIYSVAVQTLAGSSGEPIAFLGSVHDITEAHAVAQKQEWMLIAAAISVLILAIVALKFFISRNLSALDLAVEHLDSVAHGQLELDMSANQRDDEIGKLSSALGATVSKLKSIVGNIDKGADEVVAHSLQLSQLAHKNAGKTDEQKTRMDQVTIAVTQMNAAFQELASSITHISNYANETQSNSREGISQLDSLTKEMEGIASDAQALDEQIADLRGRSESIANIVEVIKGVADQTNLLALNAAIEAARAGEHGRGFAVVAEEVRNLSKNTQESIEQIEDVVAAIQQGTFNVADTVRSNSERATMGADLTQKAAGSLHVIGDRIKSLQDHISSSTAATEEMATSTDAIKGDVTSVNDMTDAVLKDVLQVAESATALQNLANGMQKDVRYFSIDQSGT